MDCHREEVWMICFENEGLVAMVCDDGLSAEIEEYETANGLFAEEYEGTLADGEGHEGGVVDQQS